MSELYKTPSQIAKELRERTKTGNWFQDSFTDYISSGITRKEDGSIQREGAAWWLQGLTPGAETIATQKQALDESRIIDEKVKRSGLTTEQIREASGGRQLTTSNVGGILSHATRTVEQTPTPLQQHTMNRQTNSDIRAAEAQEASNKLLEKQLAATIAQGNKSHSLALMQMADSREQQANQLEYQKMRDRRADQEYNERMERLDRKDRQAMLQNLAAGLASLGAAFAL